MRHKPALVEYQGRTMPIGLAVRLSGSKISVTGVRYRMKNHGWTLERALSEPLVYGGKYRRPTSWASRRAALLQIIDMMDRGMKYREIGAHIGLSRDAVAGLILRARNNNDYNLFLPVKAPTPLISARPIEPTAPICWASGCFKPRGAHSKFCDKHAFKPRIDQPMSRLMAARA